MSTKSSTEDKDCKLILNSLLENSKISYRQLAKKLNLSTTTVIKKIGQMENEGIIRRYCAHLDYNKLGFEVQAAIMARVSKGKLFEVEKKIAKHENVQAVYDVTGDYDVIIIAKFRRRAELDAFLKEIQKFEFIERTHTLLILNTLKEDCVRI
ncbi:MAG: Lrp/AsnC family transcriptional regulator [archaeon]